MLDRGCVEALRDKRHLVAILRLVVDQRDQLLYGEVLDERGSPQVKFQQWAELSDAVRRCLRGSAGPNAGAGQLDAMTSPTGEALAR